MTGREAGAEIRLFDLGDHLLRSWGRLYGELRDERLRLARRDFRVESFHRIGELERPLLG